MLTVSRRIVVLTLFAALSACSMMTPPADLDLRPTRTSAHGLYVVSMRPMIAQVDVNQIHPWEIHIASPSGAPVTGASIAFDGGMPQHGHGLPTKPRVTQELGDGNYRLDGMKFSMTGWWEMRVQIHAGQGDDQATINTVLPMAPTLPAVAVTR
jgi:hypothetical protein